MKQNQSIDYDDPIVYYIFFKKKEKKNRTQAKRVYKIKYE